MTTEHKERIEKIAANDCGLNYPVDEADLEEHNPRLLDEYQCLVYWISEERKLAIQELESKDKELAEKQNEIEKMEAVFGHEQVEVSREFNRLCTELAAKDKIIEDLQLRVRLMVSENSELRSQVNEPLFNNQKALIEAGEKVIACIGDKYADSPLGNDIFEALEHYESLKKKA